MLLTTASEQAKEFVDLSTRAIQHVLATGPPISVDLAVRLAVSAAPEC